MNRLTLALSVTAAMLVVSGWLWSRLLQYGGAITSATREHPK